jgi:hypothetical protein
VADVGRRERCKAVSQESRFSDSFGVRKIRPHHQDIESIGTNLANDLVDVIFGERDYTAMFRKDLAWP